MVMNKDRSDAIEALSAWVDPDAVYFIEEDADEEPTLWLDRGAGKYPLALFRRCDLPPIARHLFRTMARAIVKGK